MKNVLFDLNLSKAWFFEGSFSGGGQFDPPPHFKKNLPNINLTLHNY